MGACLHVGLRASLCMFLYVVLCLCVCVCASACVRLWSYLCFRAVVTILERPSSLSVIKSLLRVCLGRWVQVLHPAYLPLRSQGDDSARAATATSRGRVGR